LLRRAPGLPPPLVSSPSGFLCLFLTSLKETGVIDNTGPRKNDAGRETGLTERPETGEARMKESARIAALRALAAGVAVVGVGTGTGASGAAMAAGAAPARPV